MHTPHDIHALVFDAYGTLFDVFAVTDGLEQRFPGHGKTIAQAWRTRQLEYTWLRTLMGRYQPFDQVTRDGLRYALDQAGLSAEADDIAMLLRTYDQLALFDDAREALAELRRVVPLAILSNGTPAMLQSAVAANGLQGVFHAVLSVDAVGQFKPAPAVYQHAADQFAVACEKIGFVSSNGWDAAGAKAFGFTVFWLNRNGLPPERLDAPPDQEIRTLTDLLPLLGVARW